MPKLPVRPPSVPDEIDLALIETAEAFLAEHFFDPEVEDAYKATLSAERARMGETVLLEEVSITVRGAQCTMRLEAMRTWTMFRITLDHKDFAAAIEGSWSFEQQELQKARVSQRRGSRRVWEEALDDVDEFWSSAVLGDDDGNTFWNGDPDDDDDDDDADDADDEWLLNLDPREPPPPTSTDRARVKAIAKRLTRHIDQPMGAEDRQWLQDTPQSLPLITEALIATAKDKGSADPLVAAYGMMLGLQLELVRYRQDRGWQWAASLLEEFQQRMLGFAREGGDPALFMAMGQALSEARVPVADDMQRALAEAGFRDDDLAESGDLQQAAHAMLIELASQLDTPFEVIETFKNMDAVMPAELRGTLADILANAEQEVLREAAALLLLDRSPEVRRAVLAALNTPASVRTLSSATLRRLIAIRGWLPNAEREPVDELVRKVRLAGVEIGAWPKPLPDTEYHASMIDGSGAQSILVVSRGSSKGFFRALLLRHGEGIVDAWQEEDLSRGKLGKMLRGTQEDMVIAKVPRDFVDTVVQHAIGCSVARGTVPPELFLQIAEGLNGGDWKARQLDIPYEALRLFEALPAADRAGTAIQRNLDEAGAYLDEIETMETWFEDGPGVQTALESVARPTPEQMLTAILDNVVADHRLAWAERFVLMAMWAEAATEAKHRRLARGMITTAKVLVEGKPLAEIPAMTAIALHTLTAAMP